jgi:hypothetical protein
MLQVAESVGLGERMHGDLEVDATSTRLVGAHSRSQAAAAPFVPAQADRRVRPEREPKRRASDAPVQVVAADATPERRLSDFSRGPFDRAGLSRVDSPGADALAESLGKIARAGTIDPP